MKLNLLDIIRENLISKKIKIYHYSYNNTDIYISDKGNLPHPKNYNLVEEMISEITEISVHYDTYEGDIYTFTLIDDNNNKFNITDFESITTSIEII